MKIDFLENIGSLEEGSNFSIVRIFDFDTTEALLFMNDIIRIVMAEGKELDMSEINYCQALNCHLLFRLSDTDQGVIRSGLTDSFVCALTLTAYATMTARISMFTTAETNGYNWLHEVITPIELLFSPDGKW